jgi:large subunit ribosomal protein L19
MSHQTIEQFTAPYLKTDVPDIRSGDVVRVHQKVKEKDGNERIQMFEGIVISAKHGRGIFLWIRRL